ncbi:MAG: hypothetical protein AAF909_07730 [Pseudomonadota bacterium]
MGREPQRAGREDPGARREGARVGWTPAFAVAGAAALTAAGIWALSAFWSAPPIPSALPPAPASLEAEASSPPRAPDAPPEFAAPDNRELLSLVAQSYGFVRAQRLRAELIAGRAREAGDTPDAGEAAALAARATAARASFDGLYPRVEARLRAFLLRVADPEALAALDAQIQETAEAQDQVEPSDLFVEALQARADGALADLYYRVFAAFAYPDDPVAELDAGLYWTYRQGALGLTISAPASWRDGASPRAEARFISEMGFGQERVALRVTTAPSRLSDQVITELAAIEGAGARVIKVARSTRAGRPAARFVALLGDEEEGVALREGLALIDGEALAVVMVAIDADAASDAAALATRARFSPLIDALFERVSFDEPSAP